MPSTTPTLARACAIAMAAGVIVLSATACSASPTAGGGGDQPKAATSTAAPSSGSANGGNGSGGSNAGLCADATGEGFSLDSNASDMTKVLATWDKMEADAPGDIRDDVSTVDKALHKASTGDTSAIGDAFSKSVTAVGTWVADNCNL